MRRQLENNVNNVNAGINLSTVNNESKIDNLNIHDQSGRITATATFVSSNKTFSVSQTSSVSSSKVEDIEEESPKRKESISGNRIIDVNILGGIFGEMLCPMCECSSLALYERYEKKQGPSSLLYLKCSTSKCSEMVNSSLLQVPRDFEINQRIVYTMRSLGHGYAGIEKFNTLMNIPKPITVKNYNKIAAKIIDIVKIIAEVNMNDATKEIHENALSTEYDIVNASVFGDGTQ